MVVNLIELSNGKKYSVRENRNRIFTPSEWIGFFNCLKTRQKFTFNCLINTGARINEIRNVRVGDISFDKRTILLRNIKKRNNYSNGRVREIPISSMFVKYLKKEIRKRGLEKEKFIGILSTPAANIAMKKALQKSNVKDWYMFSVHNVRKTLETWLVSLNVGHLKTLVHFGHNQSTAIQYYLQTDLFTVDDKNLMKEIIGDLYYCDGHIDKLYEEIERLKILIKKRHKSKQSTRKK